MAVASVNVAGNATGTDARTDMSMRGIASEIGMPILYA